MTGPVRAVRVLASATILPRAVSPRPTVSGYGCSALVQGEQVVDRLAPEEHRALSVAHRDHGGPGEHVVVRGHRPPVRAGRRDGEQVDLYDNVRLHRAATAKDPETIGTTTQLTILPDEEKAYTREPVLITQGKSMIKGVGLQVDGRKQTYLLESRASAVIESKHARKQP